MTAAELEKMVRERNLPRLLDNDVPAAPVLSRFELLQDGQVQANHILEEYQSPVFGRAAAAPGRPVRPHPRWRPRAGASAGSRQRCYSQRAGV